MSPKIGIISQSRMTSTRLPGKVLMKIAGHPSLYWHFRRLEASGLPAYLATTTNATDDPLVQWAAENDIPLWRGSEEDVLSRFYGCAQMAGLDIVIRVTSDCPLIDGQLLRTFVDEYIALDDERIYMCNSSLTYPRGLDFEIFSRQLLEEAHVKARKPEQREHVTPYLYQNEEGTVRVIRKQLPEDKSHLRFTLDTADDFALLRTLIEDYSAAEKDYLNIIALLEAHPELCGLNAHIKQKSL